MIPNKIKRYLINLMGGYTSRDFDKFKEKILRGNKNNTEEINRLKTMVLSTEEAIKKLKKDFGGDAKSINLRKEVQRLKSEIRDNEGKIYKLNEELQRKQKKQNKIIPDQTKLRNWSKRIRSVNKCDCCGSTSSLTAHHLWDKNTHPSLMYQDENGVCLCLSCHNSFHSQYTSKSQVTPKLYDIFKIKFKNSEVVSRSVSDDK